MCGAGKGEFFLESQSRYRVFGFFRSHFSFPFSLPFLPVFDSHSAFAQEISTEPSKAFKYGHIE